MRGKAYRIFFLDGEGLVIRARVVEARSDAEAISQADQTGWAHWQVWIGRRLVQDSVIHQTCRPED
jgi:hypothetical protein